MRQLFAGLALTGACMFAVGCTSVINGKAMPPPGPLTQTPVSVDALDGLLLDPGQINSALGASTMKVWFSAKGMWDWSKSISDKDCLAIDGPAQDAVYAGTGWTTMRGQRLDDSVDDSKKRQHYAIQAVVAFPTAKEAKSFYSNSVPGWNNCSNRRFSDVSPNEPDTVWTVAGVTNNDGTLSTSQVQENGDGWTCQRALTVRNNIAIDIVTCAYSQNGSAASDIAMQIATRVASQ